MWSLELFSLFFPSLSAGPCYEGRVLELIHSPEELKREKKETWGSNMLNMIPGCINCLLLNNESNLES